MNIQRQEIRTGLLVIVSVAIFVAMLIYLGAPGVFVKQKTFRIFFDNAADLKPGARVLLAGRKIGQVRKLFSPVPEKDRPTPKMEVLVEVQVAEGAAIYQRVKVAMAQPSLLGESVIDFSSGEEASGLAPDGMTFIGERPGGVADAVPMIFEKVDPVLKTATTTLETLQTTAANLTAITAENADLPKAFAAFRGVGENLNALVGEKGPLRKSLGNIEQLTGDEGKLHATLENLQTLTGPESKLAGTLTNAERFTSSLASNADLEKTLRNFRRASEKLNGTVDQLGGQFSAVGANLEDASDTVKRQPWRLIWPSTKKYDERDRSPRLTPRSVPVKASPKSSSKSASRR